jgi:type II secretory pathway predicted ATPase ExeA
VVEKTESLGRLSKPSSSAPAASLPASLIPERHHLALASLVRGVLAGEPFLALTGKAGLGKTTILEACLGILAQHSLVAKRVSAPQAEPLTLRIVMGQLLGKSLEQIADEDVEQLFEAFTTGSPEHRLVFVFDDAHCLQSDVLRYLQIVFNLEAIGIPHQQVIFVGQPEFWTNLQNSRCFALSERITVRCTIEPLSDTEARNFAQRCLDQDGSSASTVFTSPALDEVVRYGAGNPGQIRLLLDHARRLGGAANSRLLAAAAVHEAAATLALPSALLEGPIPSLPHILGGRNASPQNAASGAGLPINPETSIRSLTMLRRPSTLVCLAALLFVPTPIWKQSSSEPARRVIGTADQVAQTQDIAPSDARTVSGVEVQAAPPAAVSVSSETSVPQETSSAKPLEAAADINPNVEQPTEIVVAPDQPSSDAAPATSPGTPDEVSGVPEPVELSTTPEPPPQPAARPVEEPASVRADTTQVPPAMVAEPTPPAPSADEIGATPGPASAPAISPSPDKQQATAATDGLQPAPPADVQAATAEQNLSPPAAAAQPGVVAGQGADRLEQRVGQAAPNPSFSSQAVISAPPPANPGPEPAGITSTMANPTTTTAVNPAATAQPTKLAPPPRRSLSPEMLADLLKRGDAMLAIGDISGARLYYMRAAEAGSPRAATQAGKTYDPMFLAHIGIAGMTTDTSAAAAWYRKAVALGDSEAADRLKQLGVTP